MTPRGGEVSLAVAASTAGVALGFRLADPLIGHDTRGDHAYRLALLADGAGALNARVVVLARDGERQPAQRRTSGGPRRRTARGATRARAIPRGAFGARRGHGHRRGGVDRRRRVPDP